MTNIDVEFDGMVRISSENGMELRFPLDELLKNLDEEGLKVVVEHVTNGAILDQAIERLCGESGHYEWPTDQRRAHSIMKKMEQQVLGTNMWGAFDETERNIRECIMQDDRQNRDLPYEIRSRLIDIAHGRARRLREAVALQMRKLIAEVRGE